MHEYRHATSRLASFISKTQKILKKAFSDARIRNTFIGLGALGLAVAGGLLIWVSTFALPNLDSFEQRKISESTKIYDRTGDVLLYDVHQEIRRTVVPFEEISQHVKDATIAIEDDTFYSHIGIRPISFLRAVIVNLLSGGFKQGGSTITQQVVKNALLTQEKTIPRKIKEWVLALRLEQMLTKDEILALYLNESPYGGPIYGVQEASTKFFGKDAKDLTIAESAYIAALPQAPTYYSPYGNHRDALENRKNLVLKRMMDLDYITKEEYEQAKNEVVEFQKQDNYGIKAPHFVFYIKELVEEKYGADAVETGGLKIITTLDYDIQKEAEKIVEQKALENEKNFDAENAALVAIDPKTGQILVMVGSRNYFDEEIDGNYNVATALRQPGSAFKPFVYAEAFNKGYRPETVLFDLPTEFSTTCSDGGTCYSPQNYDNAFRGPMTIRDALAQSINIPAVKALYLAGVEDSIRLAETMGISTLATAKQYGLTLVLGGGEVSPLEMTSAYSVFANNGVRNPHTGILRIEDAKGKVLEEYKEDPKQVLSAQTASQINSILSDNVARTPLFGANSIVNFPDRQVAAKTGTTNDYRDTWIAGYTPNLAAVAWAGNNDNHSIQKKVAGLVIAPLWREFMDMALAKLPVESFAPAPELDQNVKPVIRGVWNEGPVHEILHYVDRSNPLGPAPSNPARDPQYSLWEASVQQWAQTQGFETDNSVNAGGDSDRFSIQIISLEDNATYLKEAVMVVSVRAFNGTIKEGEVFLNNSSLGKLDPATASIVFTPAEIGSIKDKNNELRVEVEGNDGEKAETTIEFSTE